MKKLAELKQERASKIEAQRALHSKAEGEKRSLTEDETNEFRSLQTEIESLNGQIKDAEAYEENIRSLAAGAPSVKDGEERELETMKKRFNICAALRMAGAGGAFEGVEKEIHELGTQERQSMGQDLNNYSFNLPSTMVRAAGQTVSEDSGAFGGKLVVDQTPRPVDAFMPKLFLEEMGATLLTGLTGGDLPLPVMDNYAFTWADETEAVNPAKAGVDGPTLSPKRAAAVVLVSNRLITQSNLDVQGMVMRNLGDAAARALNGVAINGLQANKQPVGILNMSGILAAAGTTPALPTWELITELQGLLDQNDATDLSRGYLVSPKLAALLKTVKKDAGSGRFLMEAGLIDGYRTVATSLVPAIAPVVGPPAVPELHHLIFGDFSQLFIGQWGGVQFVVDPLTAANANSLKVVVNMEGDVQVANKKAFAVNSFLKLS